MIRYHATRLNCTTFDCRRSGSVGGLLHCTKKSAHSSSAARAAAGLTQAQAGALIYTPLRTWQDWEAGRRPMHPAFFELFLIKVRDRA